MGRPPGNGGPAFRFTPSEVAEMEAFLQQHNNNLPPRELFVTLAEKFSNGPDRVGKIVVQMKQVWNWFQNKRYALKAKSNKAPAKFDAAPLQAVPPLPAALAPALHTIPPVRQEVDGSPSSNMARSLAPHSGKASINMEFEARSARDGAWYDVAAFLSVRNKDTDDPEVLVRFVGLTPEEDEWIKVSKHVRHRSLPCEASECVAVLPGDLILCFQEAPDQALYFDAHVLDAQRMKHDSRGCRCRFLVRYDHDQFEEIVPLRKICRRPETDYRLQIYQTLRDLPTQEKKIDESSACSVPLANNSLAESVQMPEKVDDNTVAASSAAANQPDRATVPSSPFAHERSKGSPEEGNVGNAAGGNASKGTRKAEENLEKDDAVTKRPRKSDPVENPVGQDASTPPTVPESDKQDEIQGLAVSAAAEKGSSHAVAKEKEAGPTVSKDGAAVEAGNPNPTGVALTCQNQTNGGSSGGSSDVPVGAQQCF
uniref:Homeobox domain-containing protein n=1 Tax=Kalanchoe fedtschenkoi TaxID=63787 RepID=A0A7N0UYT6_KALFE